MLARACFTYNSMLVSFRMLAFAYNYRFWARVCMCEQTPAASLVVTLVSTPHCTQE